MKIFYNRFLLPLIFAAAFYLIARLGMLVPLSQAGNVKEVWIPAGVAFLAAAILGWQSIPSTLLGAFPAVIASGVAPFPAAAVALSYSIAPLAGTWLARHPAIHKTPFGSTRLLAIVLGAALTSLVTAAAGTLAFYLAGMAAGGDFVSNFFTWWVGDLAGILVFLPALLAIEISSHYTRTVGSSRLKQIVVYDAFTIVLVILVFSGFLPNRWLESLPYIFLILVGIASTRFNYIEIAPSIVIISSGAILAVMRGVGTFNQYSLPVDLLEAIAFTVMLNLVALVMTTASFNRLENEGKLRQAAEELESRVQLWTAELSRTNALLEEEIIGHKGTREALRLSVEQYRTVVEEQVEMVVNFTPNGTMLQVNYAFCSYFGLKREDALRKVLPHMPAVHHAEFLEMLESRSKIEPVFTAEHTYTAKDGRVRWLRWIIKSLVDSSGGQKEYLGTGQDITAARGVEQALEESRKRYKSLFEDSPISLKEEDFSAIIKLLDELRRQGVTDIEVYIKDHPDFVTGCASLVRTLDVNKASLRLYGAEYKTQLLSSLDRIFGPASVPGFGKQLVNIFNRIKMYDFETVNYTLTGERLDLLMRWAVAPGCEDTYSRVFISAIDITAGKKSAEELRESQNMLRMVMDSIPLAIYWKDLNSVYRGGNRIHALWAGIDSPESIVGKTDFEMPWAERAELFIEGDKRVVRTGISEAHILEKHIRENQREFWVDNTKSPLRNPNGEIIGVIGSLEDITSRVEAEEARKASEEKFRILFEQSYDGIMLTRPDGVITDWNRSMEEITGRKAAEMVGQHIWDFHASSVTDPAQREMVANVVRHNYQLLETTGRMPNQNKTIEVNLLRTDGEIRQVLAINYCIEVGREKVVATLLRDITSEKQYQRVALESKKLAELGTLAAGIAHEINTPLQIINGLSERMLNRVQTKTLDRDRLIRELGNINDNGWRVANIVRSLLAYARASSGEFRYCSLNTVITDTLLLIEHQLKSWSNITVVTELNPDLPNLYCESNKISQLIINLLNNASDAMPEGGNITLRTTLKGKGFICISVRDEGTGIDPAIRDRIFDPFFTTKGVSAGTGLGLSFVLGVVKAHGGEIDVETSQGGGTTFNIRLPINPPAETPQTPENDIPDRYSDQLPIKS